MCETNDHLCGRRGLVGQELSMKQGKNFPFVELLAINRYLKKKKLTAILAHKL